MGKELSGTTHLEHQIRNEFKKWNVKEWNTFKNIIINYKKESYQQNSN